MDCDKHNPLTTGVVVNHFYHGLRSRPASNFLCSFLLESHSHFYLHSLSSVIKRSNMTIIIHGNSFKPNCPLGQEHSRRKLAQEEEGVILLFSRGFLLPPPWWLSSPRTWPGSKWEKEKPSMGRWQLLLAGWICPCWVRCVPWSCHPPVDTQPQKVGHETPAPPQPLPNFPRDES